MFPFFVIACTFIACGILYLCWKIVVGVVLLPVKIATAVSKSPTPEHDYFADDTNAIWLKGKENQYFRYDLTIDSKDNPAKYKQIDEMNAFLRKYGIEDKELVNV